MKQHRFTISSSANAYRHKTGVFDFGGGEGKYTAFLNTSRTFDFSRDLVPLNRHFNFLFSRHHGIYLYSSSARWSLYGQELDSRDWYSDTWEYHVCTVQQLTEKYGR